MLLSELTNKKLFVNNSHRGTCRGIGLSLKSYTVRYLLCASTYAQDDAVDFSINTSAITSIEEHIQLTRLRSVFPKSCVKIFIGRPVYSFEGIFLGEVSDLEMQDFIATRLFTSRGETYPITSVTACSDAVILKKEQPYPIGQRIPAPILSHYTEKSEAVITKPILRGAIQKGELIKLTLSLPPFRIDELPALKRNFF